MSPLRRLFEALHQPVSPEMKELLSRRWRELPEQLQTPNQVLGRQLVHCGYTLGASYCSLGCTHCYLPRNANRTPLPSLEEMKVQRDTPPRGLKYACICHVYHDYRFYVRASDEF